MPRHRGGRRGQAILRRQPRQRRRHPLQPPRAAKHLRAAQQAHPLPAAQQQRRQRQQQQIRPRTLLLRRRLGPPVHARRPIAPQTHRLRRFPLGLAHDQPIRPRGFAPVDPPRLVAGQIRAKLPNPLAHPGPAPSMHPLPHRRRHPRRRHLQRRQPRPQCLSATGPLATLLHAGALLHIIARGKRPRPRSQCVTFSPSGPSPIHTRYTVTEASLVRAFPTRLSCRRSYS